ncbi:MAG: Na+ dependent nucleoside transporter domain-containing protein, partial [Pontibacter sp.]|nr:Na+ dependent nucleoside transporter domain-containing protein [Pontibacter sp.]
VFAFIMGVPWQDTLQVGSLLGQKTAVNEFVAYLDLANMKAAGSLGEKSLIMATYALCGFSNFSSIAIQIGGIGSMAPSQQGNLSKMGFLALLGASLACMMTATVAGMLYGI